MLYRKRRQGFWSHVTFVNTKQRSHVTATFSKSLISKKKHFAFEYIYFNGEFCVYVAHLDYFFQYICIQLSYDSYKNIFPFTF